MSTVIPPPVQPLQPPPYQPPPQRPQHTTRNVLLIIAGAIVVLIAFGVIGGLAGNKAPASAPPASAPPANSQPAVTPPTADEILSQDGYTSVQEISTSGKTGLDTAMLSGVIGLDNGNFELVVVDSATGNSGALESGITADGASSGVAVTVERHQGYNVIRATGAQGSLVNFGNALSKDGI